MAVGPNDTLVIFNPDGSKASELQAPTIAQTVKAGSSSFQVSYGRDVNNLLTAIIAPDRAAPSDLSFTVNGTRIEGDKTSVISVTFSQNLRNVSVDPGYVGAVSMNGRRISAPVATGRMATSPSADATPQVASSQPRRSPQSGPSRPAPDPGTKVRGAGSTMASLDPVPRPAPSVSAQPEPRPAPAPAVERPAPRVAKAPTPAPRSTPPPRVENTSVAAAEPEPTRSEGSRMVIDEANGLMFVEIEDHPLLIGGLGKQYQEVSGGAVRGGGGGSSWDIVEFSQPTASLAGPGGVPAWGDDPNIVPMTDYYGENGKVYLVNGSSDANQKARGVQLQLNSPWMESVTPPSGKAPSVAPDQIKLVEVRGPVSVTFPGSTQAKAATEGMIIPSGTKIETADGGSAAAFLGGVNSARFTPNSSGEVKQSLDAGKRSTTIDLKKGLVFSKVGRRAGETQDFQVRTPTGVAAAKGTDFAVLLRNGNTIVFTSSGQVNVFNSSGQLIGVAESNSQGTVSIVSTAPMSEGDKRRLLNDILRVAQSLNSKLNPILEKQRNGQPLTPDELAFSNRSPGVFFLVEARRNGFRFFPSFSPIPDPSEGPINPAGYTTDPFIPPVETLNNQIFLPGSSPLLNLPAFPPPTTPF